MGVPKFYRWISERYPCLSEVVKDYQIPEFDNLYLDMNGVVHTCSHPEDDNPHFRITEEKIMEDIFHYIEVLFRMIKPRKVFFMAIDGVAPRAKMNQQRGRRFRSAREAEDLVKKAIEKGEVLPTEERFDSNCITPGTEFMHNLHEQLKYFVVKKISTDRLWQGVRVYLSGHETPGEGEHKVMDFIRYEKSLAEYDPNTRHCLYGLDADLIMLGLITHEPHFSLLREEVRFGKQNQKKSSAAEDTTFHLLHLSLMREYLDFEFSSLRDVLPFEYDLERIIDDWVLMGFLVGNDFIPHLPDLHIHHDALPLLWKMYKRVLPTLDGYLHDGGHLHLENFEKYLRILSKIDFANFNDKQSDVKWLQSRKESKNAEKHHALTSEETGIPTAEHFMMFGTEDKDVMEDYESMISEFDFSEEESDEPDDPNKYDSSFFNDFRNFKADYYREKFKLTADLDVLKDLATGYVRAIQWILYYYYEGVPSWSWYYPHHYAPYISDLRNFSDMEMVLEFAAPFLPFQQLMAVLPAASKNLMPKPLQYLMISENSPIYDYYPVDFTTDLNGKQQDWEAVVLIPFIDEKRLIAAMLPLEEQMSDAEKSRNKHGPHILFEFSSDVQGTYSSNMFPNITNHHARITEIVKDQFWVMDKSLLKKGLCPGVKQNVYYPGFPTLQHIPHTAKLQKFGVRVFQHISRGENMTLSISPQERKSLEDVAEQMIGRSVYVGWPHLIEARVNAISDGVTKYYLVDKRSKTRITSEPETRDIEHTQMDADGADIYLKELSVVTEEYRSRKGVILGQTDILVYASPLAGNRYICGMNGDVVLEKQWSSTSHAYVLQGTIKDITVMDPTFKQFKTLDGLFSVKSEVFMLGQPHYGCMGEVMSVDTANEGRIRVDFTILQEPDMNKIINRRQGRETRYFPSYILSRRLGISGLMLSRITGCIFVSQGSTEKPGKGSRTNVALNLKLNKTQQEVPGYTRKVETEWHYSEVLGEIIGDYMHKFPDLFDFLSQSSNEMSFFADDIFGEESEVKMKEIKDYIKELPCCKVSPVPHGSDVLDDSIIRVMEQEVDLVKEMNKKGLKHIRMQVRPHLLYRPLEAQVNLIPDPTSSYALYDRIVNVRDGFSVPLGLRGTVIGITNAEKERDIVYDVVFDEAFLGGLTIRCSPNRAYRMPKTAMINITHGERKAQGTTIAKPTAVVKPVSSYSSAAGSDRMQLRQYGMNNYDKKPGNGYNGNRNRASSNHDDYHNNQGNREQIHPSKYQPPSPPQKQDEFTDLWAALQGTHLSDQTSSSQPEQSQRSTDKQAQPSKHKNGPTLQQAAFVLKKSTLEVPEQAGKLEKPTSNENVTSLSQNQENEFTAILKSLQESQNQPPIPNLGDGTALLCQMLNISQANDIGKNNISQPSSGQTMFGQQLSVEELFQGAKSSQLPETAASQPTRNPIHSDMEHNLKKSSVEQLSDWCKEQAWPQPTYDHQVQDGKHRAFVMLADGQKFKGSFARSSTQAAESAAGIALIELNGENDQVPDFEFLQRPGYTPYMGPRYLSTSPNSAFTPVRPPVRAPPQGMPMPPFIQRGPRGAPLFPMPPMFCPPNQFGPQNQFHQQRFPPGVPFRGQGHRNQGPFPRGAFPNMEPQGFWSPQPQWQNGPPRGPLFQQPPHHSRMPQNMPPHQQQQQQQQIGQGSCPAPRQLNFNNPPPPNQPQNQEDTTPKKSNPFIPFQVMQKQKTPQRESRSDSTEIAHSEPETTVGRSLNMDMTEPSSTNQLTAPSPVATRASPTGANINSSNSYQDSNLQSTPISKSTPLTTPTKSEEVYRSPSANITPGRSGKNRLAANFSAAKR